MRGALVLALFVAWPLTVLCESRSSVPTGEVFVPGDKIFVSHYLPDIQRNNIIERINKQELGELLDKAGFVPAIDSRADYHLFYGYGARNEGATTKSKKSYVPYFAVTVLDANEYRETGELRLVWKGEAKLSGSKVPESLAQTYQPLPATDIDLWSEKKISALGETVLSVLGETTDGWVISPNNKKIEVKGEGAESEELENLEFGVSTERVKQAERVVTVWRAVEQFVQGTKALNRGNNEFALQAFEKAAQVGYAPAMYVLGDMYLHGQGVKSDSQQALGWFLKSAEKGHIDSAFKLGYLYAQGEVIPGNKVESYAWFAAAALKMEDAEVARVQMASHFTAEELEQAETLAKTREISVPMPDEEGITTNQVIVSETHITPEYPELAIALELEGIVVMEVTLNEYGLIVDVEVLESYVSSDRIELKKDYRRFHLKRSEVQDALDETKRLFEKSALDAIRQWRFHPPLKNGIPLDGCKSRVTVPFSLD